MAIELGIIYTLLQFISCDGVDVEDSSEEAALVHFSRHQSVSGLALRCASPLSLSIWAACETKAVPIRRGTVASSSSTLRHRRADDCPGWSTHTSARGEIYRTRRLVWQAAIKENNSIVSESRPARRKRAGTTATLGRLHCKNKTSSTGQSLG